MNLQFDGRLGIPISHTRRWEIIAEIYRNMTISLEEDTSIQHTGTHTHSVCLILVIYVVELQILILNVTSLSPCGWTVLEWFNFCSILLPFWRAQAMRRFESSLQLISGIQQVRRGCKSSYILENHIVKLFHLESEKRIKKVYHVGIGWNAMKIPHLLFSYSSNRSFWADCQFMLILMCIFGRLR